MSVILEDFKKSFEDFCRPNRFLFSIEEFDGWEEEFEFLVKGCSIPSKTIGDINLNWQGMIYHVPADVTYDAFTITCMNDIDFKLKSFFENWAERIASTITNERGIHRTDDGTSDIKATLVVSQIGGQGEIIRVYRLRYAHPTSIGEIELDFDTTDTIQTFQVTFSYSYFEVEEATEETNTDNNTGTNSSSTRRPPESPITR